MEILHKECGTTSYEAGVVCVSLVVSVQLLLVAGIDAPLPAMSSRSVPGKGDEGPACSLPP